MLDKLQRKMCMKKFVVAVLATLGVAAVAVPANAQAISIGGPGFGIGFGVGPAYGYDSYYASDWAGPTWGVGWNSGYRSFGYPASYGYSADWDGSDVALETYVAPPVRTYAVASERYVYPR